MAKWFGKIGYVVTVESETQPGIWKKSIIEREYFGELTTDRRRRQTSSEVNDNITLSNVISIVADPFAVQNCSHMAYVEIMDARWKISDVEVQFPRLILSIGGVYNGKSSGASE